MSVRTEPESYTPDLSGCDVEVCDALQLLVVVLVDLHLQAKQAHWNLVGHSFRSLHLHLDDIVDVARDAADTFAERMRALGGFPDARASVVAATSTLLPASQGIRSTEEAVRATATRLQAVSQELRAAHKIIERLDAPTADLVNQTIVDVEKHGWMLQAEIRSSQVAG